MEGTAVVEVCERVIVALVLNAQLFKRVGGRILGKADLRAVLVRRLDAKVALFAAWQTDVCSATRFLRNSDRIIEKK